MAYSCYITFPTTYFAIRAESVLKNDDYSFKMVPVPRSISSSCGTALRCSCEELAVLREKLIENDLELEGYYKIEEAGLRTPVIEEICFDE